MVQIDSFPQYSPKMQLVCCRAIVKVFLALAEKGPVLWNCISAVGKFGIPFCFYDNEWWTLNMLYCMAKEHLVAKFFCIFWYFSVPKSSLSTVLKIFFLFSLCFWIFIVPHVKLKILTNLEKKLRSKVMLKNNSYHFFIVCLVIFFILYFISVFTFFFQCIRV